MRVLVYGDSNSWGTLADGTGRRFAGRWPRVLAERTGWEVIEDCLRGRTTAMDDPENTGVDRTGAFLNGARHLETSLLAAAPIDLVLIMLGTNDFKHRFQPSAEAVAARLLDLASLVRAVPAAPEGWETGASPAVGIVLPPPLGKLADDPTWENYAHWEGGRAASLKLNAAVQASFPEDLPFMDAGDAGIKGSNRDPIHFEPEDHETLGRTIAEWALAHWGQ